MLFSFTLLEYPTFYVSIIYLKTEVDYEFKLES